MERLGTEVKCEVHMLVLGAREGKEGWLQLYSPGSLACRDEGALWSRLLGTLVGCCCRRRAFLGPLVKWLGPLSLRALRGDTPCQMTLCAMLELDALEAPEARLQAAAALRAGASAQYGALCLRRGQVRQLQQKGGPRKLTLPARSTVTGSLVYLVLIWEKQKKLSLRKIGVLKVLKFMRWL